MEVQKTALYNYHKNLGAKFVPFAGYEMPIQYKDGIVKEHISTRQTAGFFDVSHMGQLFISGSKSLEQNLEKIIPLDFKEIKIKQNSPTISTFISKGKLELLKDIASRGDIELVIVNHSLSASQARNLEKILNKRVIDKTELILDIFVPHI